MNIKQTKKFNKNIKQKMQNEKKPLKKSENISTGKLNFFKQKQKKQE